MAMHSANARGRFSSAPPKPYYAELDDTLPSARSGIVKVSRARKARSSWLDDPATARWVVGGIWAIVLGLVVLLATLVTRGGHGL